MIILNIIFYREGCKILGKTEFSTKNAIKRIFPLTTIALAATYFNFYALSFTSATNVTAVTSTSAAFVYVMSLIWLKEPFILIRVGYIKTEKFSLLYKTVHSDKVIVLGFE